MQARTHALSMLLLSAILVPAVTAGVPVVSVTAGSNLDIDFNPEFDVPYSGFAGQYFLDAVLIHDPTAGPFFKHFQSPITDTLDPILLDALQPMPQLVTENYYLPPILAPFLTLPVAGWYAEIYTDGWQWVIPDDTAHYPGLFPPNQSLITKDGQPHPWDFPPGPAVYEPNKLRVEFPPITEGFTLDIHKALLWVGTPGNRIWGDNVLDSGDYFDESSIRVFEHPIPPHETSLAGDINGDGYIGLGDLGIILDHWNQWVPPGSTLGDITGPWGIPDGYVGLDDLDVVLGNWNAGTPPDARCQIPEPGGLMFVCLVAWLGMTRSRS